MRLKMENFIYPGLLSSVALLVYYFTLLQAGLARAKYGIKAPSHDGPEEYVRKVRVHHNTICLLYTSPRPRD